MVVTIAMSPEPFGKITSKKVELDESVQSLNDFENRAPPRVRGKNQQWNVRELCK
jgi:hypothetical protein